MSAMLSSSFSFGAFQKSELKVPDSPAMYAYTLLIAGMFAVYHAAKGNLSCLLTFSVMFECLAVCLMGLQSYSSQSAAGISAKALVLEALSLAGRLSSTLFRDGYLPVDVTGDFFYQFVDLFALATVLLLLHRVLVVQCETYEATAEMAFVAPLALGSLALAMPLHANMNSHPLFDIFWMASLFVGVVSIVPQLRMLMHARGSVDALTAHYAVAMGFSRGLSFIFMWRASKDITSQPLIRGFNHAPWVIMGSCLFHLVLLGVFTFYYMKAVAKDVLIACQSDVPVLI